MSKERPPHETCQHRCPQQQQQHQHLPEQLTLQIQCRQSPWPLVTSRQLTIHRACSVKVELFSLLPHSCSRLTLLKQLQHLQRSAQSQAVLRTPLCRSFCPRRLCRPMHHHLPKTCQHALARIQEHLPTPPKHRCWHCRRREQCQRQALLRRLACTTRQMFRLSLAAPAPQASQHSINTPLTLSLVLRLQATHRHCWPLVAACVIRCGELQTLQPLPTSTGPQSWTSSR